MMLGYARGGRINQQLDHLDQVGAEEVFSDGSQESDVLQEETSEYQALLDYAEPGDQLVITSLEVISRDYRQLLTFLTELGKLGLRLRVLNMPECSLAEFRQLFTWSLRNEQLLYPRLMQLGQEKNRNRNSYSVFSKDPEAKRLYRETMWQLLAKEKLAVIAKQKGVPIETIYRIKQELDRIKLAIVLVVCFVLAIVTIKMTESFSENIVIQLGVCIIATLIILYNTLVDSGEWD